MLERIKFIKVNRNKRYDYTPRYYDERKERLNAMIAQYEESDDEMEKDSAAYRARIKQRMERSWGLQDTYVKQTGAANIRLIIILFALLGITYFILNHVDTFSSEITVIDPLEKVD